jgi:RNA polymerase-binding transcription factor DksA
MREVGDEVDRANELAQMETENSLYLARKKAAPEQLPRADGTYEQTDCIDCGGEIPLGRLNLGKVRCIGCQSALERRARR